MWWSVSEEHWVAGGHARLVDTVSRMQKDMAILREENRILRTPVNNIIRCLKRLYDRKAGTMIQQHCNCSRI